MRLAAFFALSLSALPSAAIAAAPADQPGTDIVIEGQRQGTQIRDFVRELTPIETDDQLGRFVDPVCPAVSGLPEKEADEVAARIRNVANAVGAPVARLRCTPNLVLLVVQKKGDAITQLRGGRPDVFGELSLRQIGQLASLPGPVAAWQSVTTLGADGMPLSGAKLDKMHGSSDFVPHVRAPGFASRLGRLTIQHFAVGLVVIEAGALDRVDTRQLADYVVMRGMVGTGSNPANLPAQSILKLFNAGMTPETAPASLTWWDYALLKALYASSNRVEARVQRDQIQKLMTRELRKVANQER